MFFLIDQKFDQNFHWIDNLQMAFMAIQLREKKQKWEKWTIQNKGTGLESTENIEI